MSLLPDPLDLPGVVISPALKEQLGIPSEIERGERETEEDGWQGFCEIESDPAFLNVMLKEWGVRGARFSEIYSLDELAAEHLPKPIYGLMYCFRYFDPDAAKQEQTCPDHIWFANQLSDNSCATVAIMNLLNNIPDLELGPNLSSFREFTRDFSPFIRGEALSNFRFLKRIHNSFAAKTEKLNTDLAMKNKFDAAQKAAKRKAAAKPKTPSKATTKATPKATPKSKSTRRTPAKKKQKVAADSDSDTSGVFANAGYHYQAFIPIKDELWKLDGMDWQPEKLATLEEGEDWTTTFAPLLQQRILDLYETHGAEVNLMCLYRDPLIDLQQEWVDTRAAIKNLEDMLQMSNPQWKRSAQAKYGTHEDDPNAYVPEDDIPADIIHEGVDDMINAYDSWTLPERLEKREGFFEKRRDLRIALERAMEGVREDEKKANSQRADFETFVHAWLHELAKTGKLKEIVDDVTA